MAELGKRCVSAACALVLAAGLVPLPATARAEASELAPAAVQPAPLGDVDAEPQADYVIKDAQGFKRFRDDVNAGKTSASTTAVVTDSFKVTFGSGDVPVGTVNAGATIDSELAQGSAHPFLGTFDGGRNTITVSISSMHDGSNPKVQPPAALFGAVGQGATVRNLVVRGSVASAPGSSASSAINGTAAGAVAYLLGGTVENVANYAQVSIENTVDSGTVGNAAGGIVGYGWGTVRNCANHAAIAKANGWAAGIVGRCSAVEATTIEACYNTATVTGSGSALSGYYYRHAGIACSSGQSSSAINLDHCYNAGAICDAFSGGSDQDIMANNGLVDQTSGTVSSCFWASDKADRVGKNLSEEQAIGVEYASMWQGDAFVERLGDPYAVSALSGQLVPMLAWEGEASDGTFPLSAAETAGGSIAFYIEGGDGRQVAQRAPEGAKVTVVATPAGGYEFVEMTASDDEGKPVAIADGTFTMPASGVTVTPVFSKVDGQKLSFGIAVHDAPGTTWTKTQSKEGHLDLAIELTDVKKAGFSLDAKDDDGNWLSEEKDIAGFTLKWQRKTSDGSWADLPDASGSVQWNSLSHMPTRWGTGVPYAIRASLSEVGTTVYRCVGTWALDGYTTATAVGPELTVTVKEATDSDVVEDVFTAADLVRVAKSAANVSYKGATVTLHDDIDLSGVSAGWMPIGTKDRPFEGAFDGQGHEISNFNVTDASRGYGDAFGLFGRTDGATLKDFTLSGSVTSSAWIAGAVVGAAAGPTRIEKVRNEASVTSTATFASAQNESTGSVGFGGIAGTGALELSGCANKGDVTVSSCFAPAAGLVGGIQYSSSSIDSCYNVGAVTSTGDPDTVSEKSQYWLAGLATYTQTSSGSISNSYNAGAISAPERAGEDLTCAVAAIASGPDNGLVAPVVSGCYYLEGSAPRGLGESASNKKGTSEPIAKTGQQAKWLYGLLGEGWKHGGTANASFGGYPALDWEEDYDNLQTFDVTFDATGGSEVAGVQVEEGRTVARPVDPTRDRYVFAGWWANAAEREADKARIGGEKAVFPYTPEGTTTLYAKWLPDTAAFKAAIEAARAVEKKTGTDFTVKPDDTRAADVPKYEHYVTQSQKGTFDAAIALAKDEQLKSASKVDAEMTADGVDEAKKVLEQATDAFVQLYTDQVGTKVISLEDDDVTVNVAGISDAAFTGEQIRPVPSAVVVAGKALVQGKDYTLSWGENKEVGTGTVIVTGTDDAYTGSRTVEFAITAADIAGADVAAIAEQKFAGSPVEPGLDVTFNGGKVALAAGEGGDYTVEYANNDHAGTASATVRAVEGEGKRFRGSKTVEFSIAKGDNPLTARVKAGKETVSFAYDATSLKTASLKGMFDVKNAAGEISYEKVGRFAQIGVKDGAISVQAGTAVDSYPITVRVKAKGNDDYEKGRVDLPITVKVTRASLKGASVTLSGATFIYNKRVQKPTVKSVKLGSTTLAKGDYTVTYSNKNSKAGGSYTVTVAANSKSACYAGSTKATYRIYAKANPMTVKAKTATVKFNKTKAQTIAAKNAFAVSKAQGKVTYKKAGGDAALAVAGNGTITVAKNAKKGAHSVKVAVTAAGNKTYAPVTKTVTVKVTVK